MKKFSTSEVQIFENSTTCTVVEYPLSDKDINIAKVILTGRYPETGNAVNEICKELVYVLEGSGKVSVNNKILELTKGDVLLIEPHEKFYWDGNMTLLMPCTPAWTKEQYRLSS